MKYNKALRINEAVFHTLSKIVKVHGKDNIPDDDRLTVFYSRHKAYLDPMYIIAAVQYHTGNDSKIVAPIYPAYMGFKPKKDFPELVVLLGEKYFRKFLGDLGATPLFNKKDYDKNLARWSFDKMINLFKDSKRLLCFPEGKIERRGEKQPYQAGIVKLQQRVSEVIKYVPVDIQYKSPIRPGRVYINFGEPFDIILEMKDGRDVDGALEKLEDKILDLECEGRDIPKDNPTVQYFVGKLFTKLLLPLEPVGKYVVKKIRGVK